MNSKSIQPHELRHGRQVVTFHGDSRVMIMNLTVQDQGTANIQTQYQSQTLPPQACRDDAAPAVMTMPRATSGDDGNDGVPHGSMRVRSGETRRPPSENPRMSRKRRLPPPLSGRSTHARGMSGDLDCESRGGLLVGPLSAAAFTVSAVCGVVLSGLSGMWGPFSFSSVWGSRT